MGMIPLIYLNLQLHPCYRNQLFSYFLLTRNPSHPLAFGLFDQIYPVPCFKLNVNKIKKLDIKSSLLEETRQMKKERKWKHGWRVINLVSSLIPFKLFSGYITKGIILRQKWFSWPDEPTKTWCSLVTKLYCTAFNKYGTFKHKKYVK